MGAMNTQNACAFGHYFTEFMQTHLPMAQQLGLRVAKFDGHELHLAMPLIPNINDKSTMFGGSLYCVSVMACWGMIYLRAKMAGVETPNIVVADASIKYKLPVPADCVSVCYAPSDVIHKFESDLASGHKGRMRLHSSIQTDAGVAVEFEGRYVLLSE
jgi:thioesterase domain-containing protein